MDLGPLLRPGSVAVVGANDRPGSYADTVLTNLERAGFAGPVWGVHPTRKEVHGRDCVASLLELPEPVDVAVIAIPAAKVTAAVAEAIERGCGGAIVFAAGFGEVESGLGLEAELRRLAIDGGFPVCGPNGNGVVAVGAKAPLWGDSVPVLEPGRVAMVSQSGNVAVNAIGSRRGIDFHTLISTGNQAVLDASDWLGALAESDGVGSVAMFLEADGDGAGLAEALAKCAERGIGVAVLKVGSSDAGGRAAAAHTGALAGDQRVFQALVEEAGGAWAADPHDLLELARALSDPRARPRGPGFAVLTCSGGDSGLAADEAARLGLELPELAEASRSQLSGLLPDAATIANPLDYTSLIWAETDRLRRIAATVGDDPAVDLLLCCFDQPQGLSPEHEAEWAAVRDGLAAGAIESSATAIFASTLPDLLDGDAARELAERGVPTVAGLRTALACAAALQAPGGDPARLREIAAAARDRAEGADSEDSWLGEATTKQLLREAGIGVPAGHVATNLDVCIEIAREAGWPVALKLSSPSLQHKTEAGAIALGLDNEDELRHAFMRLARLPAADGAGASFLVEAMAKPGVELVVAARADAVVPALVIGLGGVWTEALDDVAVVPLPARRERVEAALRSLRGAAVLTGDRGREGVDVPALAELAARVGELLIERDLSLLELNPVVAWPDGAVAVDAIARR